MKRMKKTLALVTALAMLLTMVVATGLTAFAAGTGTITITPPTGTAAGTTNTYKIYKVFDADGNGTAISYKLCSGDTLSADMIEAGFSVDSAGNVSGPETLDAAAIAAIADYVTEADQVDTATSTGTADAVSKSLANGYYYITTSTGTAVTINSTNPSVEVLDKNEVPPTTKVIDGVSTGSFDAAGKNAIAQVGSTVSYTATVKVVAGQKNYVFHDKMGTGLTYNNDAAVTGITADQYTIKPTPDAGDTLTITFADGIAVNTVITIKYSATVNSSALTVDYANNTASVSYGDGNASSSVPEDPKVYTAGISAMKYDGNNTEATTDDTPLPEAGFKLKNSEGKFYKLANGVVTWVAEADGDEHVSGTDGKVAEFTGLGSGTYTLVETTVPSGYNKAADQDITIGNAKPDPTQADLHKTTDFFNNKGTVLPSTGGIGTTIFYVLGSLLVVGCGIVLISRKRMQDK